MPQFANFAYFQVYIFHYLNIVVWQQKWKGEDISVWQIDFSGCIMSLRSILSVTRVQNGKLVHLNSHDDKNYLYMIVFFKLYLIFNLPKTLSLVDAPWSKTQRQWLRGWCQCREEETRRILVSTSARKGTQHKWSKLCACKGTVHIRLPFMKVNVTKAIWFLWWNLKHHTYFIFKALDFEC